MVTLKRFKKQEKLHSPRLRCTGVLRSHTCALALICLCLCFAIPARTQTVVAPFITPAIQFSDNNGNPLPSGCVFFYAAGTTTPQNTYTDSTGSVAASNPVILDSAGRAQIWLSALAYKIKVFSSGGVNCATGTQVGVTVDNVTWTTPLSTFLGLTVAGNLNITQPTAATSGANQSSFTDCIHGTYWNGAASTDDKWCFQDVLGTGSNPTTTETLSHSGSSGASALDLTAAATTKMQSATVAGTLTAPTLNNTFYANGSTLTLEGAYSACVSQGSGTIILLPGFTETLSSAVTLTGKCSILLPELGTITVPAGKEFACSTNCDGVSIVGKNILLNSGNAGFSFICSPGASTACFTIGSGSTQFSGVTLKGFTINLSNTSAGAIGLSTEQLIAYDINIRIVVTITINAQVGWKMDGTGSFHGDARSVGFLWGNSIPTCLSMNNNSNENTLFVVCSNAPSGATPVVINSGNGNIIYEDIESAAGIANTIASNANNTHNKIICYCQGNTGTPHDITIGPLATGNTFENSGAALAEPSAGVTDSGTNNSIIDPYNLKTDVSGNMTLTGSNAAFQAGNSGVGYGAGAGPIIAAGSGGAFLDLENAAGGTDDKWWEFFLGGTALTFRTVNDAKNNAGVFWVANRTGVTASNTTFNAPIIVNNGPQAAGVAAGLTGTGACATITTQTGGSWAGSAKCTGTTGASTLTITPGTTAPTGWGCTVQDETTRGNLFQQTSHTQTTAVFTITSVTQNDVFVFSGCTAF